VHSVKFVVEFCEIRVGVPRGEGVISGSVDVRDYATPC
jgi:hypothetical protein